MAGGTGEYPKGWFHRKGCATIGAGQGPEAEGLGGEGGILGHFGKEGRGGLLLKERSGHSIEEEGKSPSIAFELNLPQGEEDQREDSVEEPAPGDILGCEILLGPIPGLLPVHGHRNYLTPAGEFRGVEETKCQDLGTNAQRAEIQGGKVRGQKGPVEVGPGQGILFLLEWGKIFHFPSLSPLSERSQRGISCRSRGGQRRGDFLIPPAPAKIETDQPIERDEGEVNIADCALSSPGG